MLKVLGSVLILCCSAGLGIVSSKELKRRCMQLRILKQAIYMLRGEIKHSRAPLPEAFLTLSQRIASPFSEFFLAVTEGLEKQDGRGISKIWKEEIGLALNQSLLKKDEKQRLSQLGEGLGYLDLEMQLSTLELYLEQLELDIRRAQEDVSTKQKLYQSLGVAAGIFLVIILI